MRWKDLENTTHYFNRENNKSQPTIMVSWLSFLEQNLITNFTEFS